MNLSKYGLYITAYVNKSNLICSYTKILCTRTAYAHLILVLLLVLVDLLLFAAAAGGVNPTYEVDAAPAVLAE